MRVTPRVLLVHDDATIARLLAARLEREHFDVAERRALQLPELDELDPDLALLQLGGELGLAPLIGTRASTGAAVIGLLDDDPELDVVSVIEAGADDCLARPFSPRELVARVRAVLRRVQPDLSEEYLLGELHLDVRSRSAELAGRPLDLPPRQFELLLYFVRHPEVVITRRQLLEDVWASSTDWQSEDTVTEHVFRLRQQIEADPARPRHLLTVRGVGYRFSARSTSASRRLSITTMAPSTAPPTGSGVISTRQST